MARKTEAQIRTQKANFLKALRAENGNVKRACDVASIPRRTVYDWKVKDQSFADEVSNVGEEIKDFAETQLLTAMRGIPDMSKDEKGNEVQVGWKVKPDTTAIIFFLKTKAKDRGYIEVIQKEEKHVDEFSDWSDEELKAELEK